MNRAIIVFHGRSVRSWRRVFKAGFRHCFAVAECGDYWILVDPQEGRPELRVIAGAEFDLRQFYQAQGFTAVEIMVGNPIFRLPVMPATCVASVKRIIGLRAPLILTPWQLYRRLRSGRNACKY